MTLTPKLVAHVLLLRYLTLTLKELTLFTNVTKLEKFVDQEVCVSSEFEKSEKSQKNTFRQGENLRVPQIRLFQGQAPWKHVLTRMWGPR